MDNNLLPGLSRWTSSGYGYTTLFLGMLPEGPVLTMAAAFAATLGYFNIWLVFLISVLGNFLPDTAYYLFGFFGGRWVIDRFGKYMLLTPDRMAKLENLFRQNAGKTILAVKLLPLIATPGLIIAGIARVPAKKYLFYSIIFTVPILAAFTLVGYYFGEAYKEMVEYISYGGYIALGILMVFIIISLLYKKFSKKLAEEVGKI